MDGATNLNQRSKEMADHLNHVSYPASKQDLVEACEDMSDVSQDDKKWFMDKLPDKTFNDSDEVKHALGASM
ncbi:DUF2795 domain-containing protein [Patescibacteria group bacterium]|nr:DUF2795 domain-containing protein [Patescibacteria group bacterium]